MLYNGLNPKNYIRGGLNLEKSKKEITDKAFEQAKKYELEYGDCAQCALAGVFDALGIENKDVFRSATGLADGVGLTGDGHCGALSGGVMAISYLFGRQKDEFHRRGKVLKAITISRALHDKFKEKYGTCRCHDLQVKFYGRFFDLFDQGEWEGALKAGLPETCSTLAGEVARMTTELILEQMDKEAAKT